MSEGVTEFTTEFFAESSKAWMKNKVRRGASMSYKCQAICKNGMPCKQTAKVIDFDIIVCRIHSKQMDN